VVSPAVLARLEHDPEVLRQRAGDLLSRPPYRQDEEGALARAWAAARDWLADLVDRVVGAVAADPALGWLVVALGVAVLLLVAWRATRGLAMDRAVAVAPTTGSRGRSSRKWSADADAHEAQGRWDEAVRCRYLELATRLAELGLVDDVPGRTVGELDREVETAAPSLAGDVVSAGAVFAETFYGRLPAGPEEARAVADAARRLERRGARGPAGSVTGAGRAT
jgi:hypothetical protein